MVPDSVTNILEVANVHSGNFRYLVDLINEFSSLKPGYGIKFQPFKYDEIALPDYQWFDVYKKLFFSEEQWREIINAASETKEVWLDMFDEYSCRVAQDNIDLIRGFKFQASTLYNETLIRKFSELELSNKDVILNISGYSPENIEEVTCKFRELAQPRNLILQVGFQSYPTSLSDSGLSKIRLLTDRFNLPVCIADHIDANSDDSLYLPVFAVMTGATYVEKHIRLTGPLPEYDYQSSLDFSRYKRYIEILDSYSGLLNSDFINSAEEKYLEGTIQIPVAKHSISAGSILNIERDLVFRRSDQKGLRVNGIGERIGSRSILVNPVMVNSTLTETDFKRASIGAVVACRMKSSRLPHKAIKEIGDITSVEQCLKSTLTFNEVDTVVLATSDLEEDSVLKNYTYNEDVKFFRGDPEDVMQRFLDALEEYKIDLFVRITADMPYVSNEIFSILLDSHFSSGADYTRANEAAIGTNLEIINTSALKKAKSYFKTANYSEYMTYYFINNPDYFRLNYVDLPKHLIRDYRLTLDYPEDLEMFNIIHSRLRADGREETIENIFELLDSNPEVARINMGMEVRYHTDKDLIDKLNRYTRIKD